MKKLLQWKGNTFESSTGLIEEYFKFNRCFKRVMKSIVTNLGGTITGFTTGNFCTSGFITIGDKHVFISISDVRHYKDGWLNNILIRRASDTNDYRGGSNHFTGLLDLQDNIKRLL